MKRRLFWTFMGIAVLALIYTAVPLPSPSRASAQAAPVSDVNPHMSMTKLRSIEPGDSERAGIILAAAKQVAERYRDYRKAVADGYEIFMPDQHQNVYHFVRYAGDSDARAGFDPDNPHALLYTKTEGTNPGYELVGVMYTAPYASTEGDLNARIPLSVARWHIHLNMCIPQEQVRRDWLIGDAKFGLSGSISTAEACRAAGGRFLPHLSGWMTHVYPFETDPSKTWEKGMDDHHGMEKASMPGMKM